MTRKQLKLLRLYHNLTQEQYAKEIGVATSTISKSEAGIIEVSDSTRAKVLRKYNPSESGFLEFTERMQGATNQ